MHVEIAISPRAMPSKPNRPPLAHRRLVRERKAYLDGLPPPDPNVPADVRAVITDVHEHLFEPMLRVRDVRERCGLYNNNISTRFDYYIGMGIKDYILHHRVALAKRLLRQTDVPVKYVAWTIGYGNPSGFSTTFKRRAGCTPTEFREMSR